MLDILLVVNSVSLFFTNVMPSAVRHLGETSIEAAKRELYEETS